MVTYHISEIGYFGKTLIYHKLKRHGGKQERERQLEAILR